MRSSLALAALLSAAPLWAAIGYARFEHPRGEYSVEHPSDWKRSFGLQTLLLHPSGREGSKVRVSVERHPLGTGEAATASEFEASLVRKASGMKKVEVRGDTSVSGRPARRLSLVETAELRGKFGQKLEGPLHETYLLVPFEGFFYVLKAEGVGPGFQKVLPEFDRLVKSVRFSAKKG